MKLPRLPRSTTVLHAKYTAEQMKAYAQKCVELEREACANLCWKNENDNAFVNAYKGIRMDLLCSELIRARGQA
jgi:hypothetical protein